MEIHSRDKGAAAGRYQVTLERLSPAATEDRIRMAAERVNEEGFQLQNQGVVALRLKSIEKYEEALRLWQRIGDLAVGDQMGQAMALFGIAQVERGRGNLMEARTHAEAALNIIESLRAKVLSQDLRATHFATVQPYYEFYVHVLMRLHQEHPSDGLNALGLQASERARARSLLETLAEARADIRYGVDPDLLARERDLQQRLNAKAERLTRLLSEKPSQEETMVLRQEMDDLLTQYQEVEGQIRAKGPRYAALNGINVFPKYIELVRQLMG